ncbi:MAG: 4'-phosphopantetheinyl transferase superfamily protein [Verrucomicrobiae bacterium]|nr:4'-phosphopantetheinyl transferase superfamily protein [Verrucomicrobiae bacterium]
MTPGEVVIHRIDLAAERPDHLAPDEQERAARFHQEIDRRRWTNARSALREILAAELGIVPAGVPLEVTNFEKPILAAPCDFLHFNLAHCEDIMLLALCIDGPVGIDIEPLERAAGLSGCEETFCHPQEIAALPEGEEARNERLLEIWTAKEALLKAAGCGLLHPPEAVWIDGEGTRPGWRSDPPLAGIDGWELRALDDVRLAGHRAFVCTPPGSRLRFAGAHS